MQKTKRCKVTVWEETQKPIKGKVTVIDEITTPRIVEVTSFKVEKVTQFQATEVKSAINGEVITPKKEVV